MATRIKLRRDTAANWLEQNPILAQGETGFETDTRMMKLGDGATRWGDLKYAVTGDLQITNDTVHGGTSVSLSSGIGNRENWVLLTNANDGDVNSPTDALIDGVAYDSQGNVYAMGWYERAPVGTGCYLQKISPSGEVLFNTFYNEYESYGFGLTIDKNDDVILILGENDSSSDDILLVKVSGLDGTIIWQKYINSGGDYNDYASCIDTDIHGDIFITGKSGNNSNSQVAYVGKFSGANGSSLWQKTYDIEGFTSYGTGLTVDKDGNLAVVGSNEWMNGFIAVYKINGSSGDIMWQSKITGSKIYDGNVPSGALASSDITADTKGNFYFTFNSYVAFWPGVVVMVAKIDGSTGNPSWARRLNFDNYYEAAGAGSIICDELDNLYLSSTITRYKNNYDLDDDSYRPCQHILKMNTTGSVIWERFLSQEQAETYDGRMSSQDVVWNGQTIRVNSNYILVGGNYKFQWAYNENNQYWYTQPYVAQLSRDGTEFDVDGWKFEASHLEGAFETIFDDPNDFNFDPTLVSDLSVVVTNGTITGAESNTDTTNLVYINKSNVNKVTFSEKTFTLPEGGSINVSREKIGQFTSIGGGFDGNEGWNDQGDIWLNGSDRDNEGATYTAGGWYNRNQWNNWSSFRNNPMVFKTDKDGKLIWSAGNALDQDYSSPDLVDVVYDPNTHTVIALGNDGELDGNEGFNILYLDADTGSMKQPITHIRPDSSNSNDIYPTTLSVMSDGTPVVGGYITSARASIDDVTNGAAGLTGSTSSGTLVLLKSKFVGDTTEYPKEDNSWYIYPDGATINSVNRFGHDEAYPTITYTGTVGTGATFTLGISSGAPFTTNLTNGGSGYKAGQKVKILGTSLGGTSPDNDLYFYVNTVDGNGAIIDITGDWNFETSPPTDNLGGFTDVAAIGLAGTGLQGWVQYAPEGTEYTLFNIDTSGYGYGVGDTFKILGTALGGTSPANDLTITVTQINQTGAGNGSVTGVSLAGTPQDTNIKLYGGGADYTQTGTYTIVHELANDSFIWTPTWSKVFGSKEGSYTYDELYGVTLDSSDNVIVGGYSENTGLGSNTTWYGSYNQTGIVSKFSPIGELLWSKSLDGSEGASTVWGVATDTDDNIYSVMVSTNTNSDPYITKLTSDGDYVWQQSVGVWNSNAWAIDVADNGDVMIAGECYIQEFNNDHHNGNWNLLVVKYDKDGNKLFSRTIWSQNGVRFNNNDNYSNQLTIKDGRFSIAAYSYDPGDYDSCGLVIDLPLDGSGTGVYADFHYDEHEIYRNQRFDTNSVNGHAIVSDVLNSQSVRQYTFQDAPYTDSDAWRNVTIYAQRQGLVNPVYKKDGGEIKGVAKITFEDGSEQTSSMQGLQQVRRSQVNSGNNNYWLRLEDNGKHILQENNNTIYIPSHDRLELPVGFAFTIVNKNSDSYVVSENNDDTIYLSGDNGNNSSGYNIPRWSMATLVKIEQYTWMIAGSGLSSY